jgi:hypothetical protein
MFLQENSAHASKMPDIISISGEARKRQILSKISNNIVSNITREEYLTKENNDITQENILLSPDGKGEQL